MKFSLKRNEICYPGLAWYLNEISCRVKYVCQEPWEKVTAFCQMKESSVGWLGASRGLIFNIRSFCLTTPPPSLGKYLTYRMFNTRKSSSSCGMYCPKRIFVRLFKIVIEWCWRFCPLFVFVFAFFYGLSVNKTLTALFKYNP